MEATDRITSTADLCNGAYIRLYFTPNLPILLVDGRYFPPQNAPFCGRNLDCHLIHGSLAAWHSGYTLVTYFTGLM